jgi:hypothetical protein
MQLLAHSIDQFVTDPCVHYVVIEDNNTSFSEWLALLLPHYTRHQLKLVHDYNLNSDLGYYRQQQIKLQIARHIVSAQYLVLDSKNIFFKPVSIASWPTNHGNLDLHPLENNINFTRYIPWTEYVCGKYNLKKPAIVFNNITPFVMNTNIIKSMLEEMDLCEVLPHNTMYTNNRLEPSEFLLYAIYIHNKIPEVFASTTASPEFTSWWASGAWKGAPGRNLETNSLIIGIHKWVHIRLPNKAKSIYNWLLSKGLKKEYLDPVFLVDTV